MSFLFHVLYEHGIEIVSRVPHELPLFTFHLDSLRFSLLLSSVVVVVVLLRIAVAPVIVLLFLYRVVVINMQAQALQWTGISLADLAHYADGVEEELYLQSVPPFPVKKDMPQTQSFSACNETPPPHIPPFFPTLPDSHTHKFTSQYPVPKQAPEERQEELTKQQEGGENAYLKVQARAAQDDAVLQKVAGTTTEEAVAQAGRSKQGPHEASFKNMFLVPPVLDVERSDAMDIDKASSKVPFGNHWETDVASEPAAPGLQFAGWQWGENIDSQISLTTGGTRQSQKIADAFGAIPDAEHTEIGGRRRLMYFEDPKRARVRELVSSRIEEDQTQSFVNFEDEQI